MTVVETLDTAVTLTRSADGVRRLTGLIVPWDVEIVYAGAVESFAPGSLSAAEGQPVPLRFGHLADRGHEPAPVGVLERSADTDAGLWGEFRLLDSPAAANSVAAVEAGLVTGLSAEFRNLDRAGSGGQGRIRRARLHGAALVERPAYDGARVTSIRSLRPVWDSWHAWLTTLGPTQEGP